MMGSMGAQPLKVISSMATRELLSELVAGYRRDTARPVTTEAAGGVDVAELAGLKVTAAQLLP